jgi:phosphate transport system permease protein
MDFYSTSSNLTSSSNWEIPLHRRWVNQIMWAAALVCAILTLGSLAMIVLYVLWRGVQRVDIALFTQLPPAAGLVGGGVANAILGTLVVVSLSAAIALPLGLLAGLYIADVEGDRPFSDLIRLMANVLSGLPSILAGVFAYGALVTNVTGFSAIAGSVALAIVMLPIVVRTTDEALRSVPEELRWAATSLGASSTQLILGILIPAARPGILTGMMLAIARAAGETAPLLFTALNSSLFPSGLLEPIPTLSVLIYNFAIAPFPAQQELAWAAALLLVSLVCVTSMLSRWVTHTALK